MKRRITCLIVIGSVLIGSALAFGQPVGQTPVPPAQPPAATAPAEQPPATQPALQTTPLPTPPACGLKRPGPHRFFDPNTVETLAGQVVTVQRGPVRQGGKGNLVRLTLKTDQGPVQVFLGPAKYVDAQPVKLAAGDQVEVKASKITGPKGKTTYTAAEITKNGQVLKLRDDQGMPLWPRGQRKIHRVPQSH